MTDVEGQWQPIETAPAVGRILCWVPGDGARFLYRYDEHPRTKKPQWEDEVELDQWWELEACPPTHWMPVPEDPNAGNA